MESASTPALSGVDTLVALNEAGLVSFDTLGGGAVGLDSWPSPNTRMLLIDGSQAHPPPGTVSIPVLRAAAAAGGRLALAEVFRPTPTIKARGRRRAGGAGGPGPLPGRSPPSTTSTSCGARWR